MIRIAVLGAGHWGPNLIRNFHEHEGSRVTWVVDKNPVRLQQVALRYPGVHVSDDAGEAIGASDVDAVVVATPTSTHHALTYQALDHDKHVLVEKPLATSVSGAEDLCRLADERGVVLMVGHVFIYNVAVQAAKGFIDGGDLGPVYYVSMVRTNLGPIRVDVNAAWDLAPHDVSIANYWLDATPIAVTAYGGTWINPGVEDVLFATLRYPGNVLVNVHVSWLSPRKARDITVVGERRMLTLDDMNFTEPIRLYNKGVSEERQAPNFVDTFASFRSSVREGEIVIPKVPVGEPLRSECDHFVQCVTAGKAPLTGGREGLAVVRALAALDRSLRRAGAEEPVSD